MNELLKNTHAFVDVLSMARCDAVQQWDEGAFQKAYKWANYFEEVYHRLQTKPSLAEKLDKYLENFNKSGQIFLGSFKLSLEALGKSKSLLRQFLLQNPHLSESQYQLVLKLYGVTVGGNQGCGEKSDLLADAFHLSQTKAAFKILCKMRDRLTEDMASSQDDTTVKASSRSPSSGAEEFPSAVSSEEVCVDATAHCLFKHVEHLLKFGDPHTRKKLLSEKLQVLADQENGLGGIVTSLLLTPDDCQSGQQAYHVTEFILDCLLEFLSRTEARRCLMSIPPHHLSRVAFMYDAFLEVYLSHLLKWAENMTPRICTNENDCHTSRGIQWRYKFSGASQSTKDMDVKHSAFTNLVNHLRHLVSGPDTVAAITKKELRSRLVERDATIRTGDGRILGPLKLNIWEDICELVAL